jgi:hypothetical protein
MVWSVWVWLVAVVDEDHFAHVEYGMEMGLVWNGFDVSWCCMLEMRLYGGQFNQT